MMPAVMPHGFSHDLPMEGRTLPKGSIRKSHIPSSLKQGMNVNWKWLWSLQLNRFFFGKWCFVEVKPILRDELRGCTLRKGLQKGTGLLFLFFWWVELTPKYHYHFFVSTGLFSCRGKLLQSVLSTLDLATSLQFRKLVCDPSEMD